MMQMMISQQIDYEECVIETDCPTCREHAIFTYRGKQVFPEVVAAKLGLPSVIHLFDCDDCHSTISHVDLGIEL